MKKIFWILLIAVLAVGGYSLTKYNDLMRAEEDINSVWGMLNLLTNAERI